MQDQEDCVLYIHTLASHLAGYGEDTEQRTISMPMLKRDAIQSIKKEEKKVSFFIQNCGEEHKKYPGKANSHSH